MREKTPQERAKEKWTKKNPELQKKYVAKSNCKRYIRDFADKEDLDEVKVWILEKEKNLKNL